MTTTQQNVGKQCLWCNYVRQQDDASPYWACPKCDKAYNKPPLNVSPKSTDNTEWFVNQSPWYQRHTNTLIATIFYCCVIVYATMTGWEYVPDKMTAEEYVIAISCLTLWVVFGEKITKKYYDYMPLRTGIAVFARKNPHEDRMLLKNLPKAIRLIAWAVLIWLAFFA